MHDYIVKSGRFFSNPRPFWRNQSANRLNADGTTLRFVLFHLVPFLTVEISFGINARTGIVLWRKILARINQKSPSTLHERTDFIFASTMSANVCNLICYVDIKSFRTMAIGSYRNIALNAVGDSFVEHINCYFCVDCMPIFHCINDAVYT